MNEFAQGKVGNINVPARQWTITTLLFSTMMPLIYGRNSAIALAEMDIPTPYAGISEGLAEVASFLASDGEPYITGQVITGDEGLTAHGDECIKSSKRRLADAR